MQFGWARKLYVGRNKPNLRPVSRVIEFQLQSSKKGCRCGAPHLHPFLDLCYTYRVNNDQHIWKTWANSLHRWGLDHVVVTILEATAPLHWLGAQVIHVGQPLFSQVAPENHVLALTKILENPDKSQAFMAFLRQNA